MVLKINCNPFKISIRTLVIFEKLIIKFTVKKSRANGQDTQQSLQKKNITKKNKGNVLLQLEDFF